MSRRFEEFIEKYQKVPVREYSNHVVENIPAPMVSCRVSTYMHAPYIRQCLEGILMQKTNFPFEIIIGEDESTDGTREICMEYAMKNPDKIRLFLHDRANNILVNGAPSAKFQGIYSMFQCRGKYQAVCEGDDYWTDPLKLQKQVDFLEQHPEYSLCFHDVVMLYDNGTQKLSQSNHSTSIDTQYIIRQGRPCHTCSMIFRNPKELAGDMLKYLSFLSGDIAMMLDLSLLGKFGHIDGIMATYRMHGGGMTKTRKFLENWRASYVALLESFDQLTAKQFHAASALKIKDIRLEQIKSAPTFKQFIALFSKLLRNNSRISAADLRVVFIVFLKLSYAGLKLYYLKRTLYHLLANAKKYVINMLASWKTGSGEIDAPSSILNNTVVSPYTGLILDHKRKIYPASAFSTHKIPALYTLFRRSKLSQPVFDDATIIGHGPWDNYYHWYIDVVPRIHSLYLEAYKQINAINLLIAKKLPDEEKGFLKSLLPENVKWEEVPQNALYRIKHAVFLPFLSKDCNGHLPPDYLDFFLDRAKDYFNLEEKPGIKLFITRKFAATRQLKNGAEVESWMVQQGFQVCALEQMSIREQAQLFYNAEVVVAQHGAGLTNLLYCRSGNAQVVEIFAAPNTHLNHYRGLCEAKQLAYTPIYLDGKKKNDEVHCDLRLLENALNLAVADKVN